MPVIKIDKCLNCGVKHEWLFSGMTLRELRELKKLTGMTANQFATAGDDGDPEALAALVWILHKRDKITVGFDDVDLDFNDFSMEPTEQEKKEIEELEQRMQRAAENGKEIPKA
jgi:hypothetical protein